ncbi:hypothetical protein R1sor_018060 [Riccia sorocarpa]|uniref:Uncharacterized protein n=1 Tax=Riccia sorocarpa TaxID=122646 RepID=A0ABD3I8P5_9MARC
MRSASTFVTISSDSKSHEAAGGDEADSSDVEILDSTPRNRPPTRRNPTVREVRTRLTDTHANATMTGSTQFGMPVVESDVDEHKWHVSRISNRGAGPVCSAETPGRQAPRALCKTKLKSSSLQRRGIGVVGLCFVGTSTFMAIQQGSVATSTCSEILSGYLHADSAAMATERDRDDLVSSKDVPDHLFRAEVSSLKETLKRVQDENAEASRKVLALLNELTARNKHCAQALRQIVILTMDLEQSHISQKHAKEELDIFREDLLSRSQLLEDALADHRH